MEETPRPDRSSGEPSNVLGEVADAVGLQEGEAGVREVLRAVYLLSPPATRAVSRQTGIPVPIVAAINNELRVRGILTRDRPARLTGQGAALVERLGIPTSLDATCEHCHGRGITIPEELTAAVQSLRHIMSQAPAVDLTLDQSHCTPETKVRRVLFMIRAGALPGESLLLVGDDDLIALAIGVVGVILGAPLVRRLAVVDISPEILRFLDEQLSSMGLPAELVRHDLRAPLPVVLRGQFGAAMTDPPYTPDGARLFLSRAVEGLSGGPGRVVFLSFGPKGPDDAFQVQQSITDLGLTTTAMIRNFNEYEGAGILGGTCHLLQLATTSHTRPLVEGTYQGPLYTADMRDAARAYQCRSCGDKIPVRPASRWSSVGQLKAEGCPRCGGRRFRPLQLIPAHRSRG